MLTSEGLKTRARELGFDLCGVAPVAAFPELSFLRTWLERGFGGTMGYLPRSAKRRADVRRALPSVRSVIMVGAVYNTRHAYSTGRDDRSVGEVARYAWSDDYHAVLGSRLDSLLAWMRERSPAPFEALAYVDTGPVQERVYAQYAGLGWIGKNSCLINPEIGSWVLLGAILSSLPLDADVPGVDQCGTCTLCLEACPTQAFVEPHVLDATRCVSYLTVEYRGSIPEQHRAAIGNHIFGCDVCQEVCPWNGQAVTTADPSWSSRDDVNLASLIDLWRRSDRELEAFIGSTPMTRTGVRGLRRNLAVALGNSGDPRALDALRAPADASAADPVVAEHVTWAQSRLSGADAAASPVPSTQS